MIAGALGDGPILLLVLAVAVGWARSSDREARRYDRQADRDGDAQLVVYNAYLASLRSPRQRPAPPITSPSNGLPPARWPRPTPASLRRDAQRMALVVSTASR